VEATGHFQDQPYPSISERWSSGFLIGYGQTEASPLTHLTTRNDSLERRVETVGRNLPHQEVKIVDTENGATLALGEIGEVAVFGVPDERLGEQVAAWIQLHSGANASEDEIRLFCKDNIAHFKIPQYIRFVDEFPMTITGKLQKFKMREAMQKHLQ
jgi:acyl-CoA synthetase (AMP-forming)/AMP-acid ligase II